MIRRSLRSADKTCPCIGTSRQCVSLDWFSQEKKEKLALFCCFYGNVRLSGFFARKNLKRKWGKYFFKAVDGGTNLLEHPQSLFLTVGIFVAVGIGLYYSVVAKKQPSIRRFAALEAMDEGIGIAVETGKRIHFGVPGGLGSGTGEGGSASTLQTMAIMGYFAEKAAKAGVSTVYSVSTAPTLTLAEGIIREAYLHAGKLEDFDNPNMVQLRFIAGGEGVYPAFYAGLMQRNMAASIANVGGKYKLTCGEANQQAGVFGINLSPSYDKLEWGIATYDSSWGRRASWTPNSGRRERVVPLTRRASTAANGCFHERTGSIPARAPMPAIAPCRNCSGRARRPRRWWPLTT